MSVLNLDGYFRARTIAVVGPDAIGPAALAVLARRMTSAPRRPAVSLVGLGPCDWPGEAARFDTVRDLTQPPDLAVLICHARDALDAVTRLAALGTRAVVIVSRGYDAWPADLVDAMLKMARTVGLRIIGPGSLGIVVPRIGLDASMAAIEVAGGDLAIVSRSAAMINTILAWGREHGVGFSSVVSLGQKVDVDIGDLLDQLAQDSGTRAILVHLESVTNPVKFMSAARACARVKPVVVIRSGASRDRRASGAGLVGRLAWPDAVNDAAFRRAGLLRVDSVDQLFEAVETITRVKPVAAHRLALIANGASLATIGADHLVQTGGEPAELAHATRIALAPFVRPASGFRGAITLVDDAGPAAYATSLAALLDDPGVDAVFVVQAPQALVDSPAVAAAVGEAVLARKRRQLPSKPVIAVFLDLRPETRKALEAGGVPCHATPEGAIRSWLHLSRYADAQEHLMAIPPSLPPDFTPEPAAARALIAGVSGGGSTLLDAATARAVLAAYDQPVHDVLPDGLDLVAGIADDPVFGPVAVIGSGRTTLELMSTRALDLVPLDLNLARGLVERVRASSLVTGRPWPAAGGLDALALVLVKLSQLAVDVPEVMEIDLPLVLGDDGQLHAGLPAIRVAPQTARAGRLGHPRLAIRPYPKEWERDYQIEGGAELLIRPVQPEDEARYPEFLAQVSADDIRLRFFAPIKEFSHAFLARLTQLDYARAIAFAACDKETGAILGVVRLHADPDHHVGEYAILLRSDMKGIGLGRAMMQLILDWAVADGLETVKGEVLRSNSAMLGLCRDLGFTVRASQDDESIADVRWVAAG